MRAAREARRREVPADARPPTYSSEVQRCSVAWRNPRASRATRASRASRASRGAVRPATCRKGEVRRTTRRSAAPILSLFLIYSLHVRGDSAFALSYKHAALSPIKKTFE